MQTDDTNTSENNEDTDLSDNSSTNESTGVDESHSESTDSPDQPTAGNDASDDVAAEEPIVVSSDVSSTPVVPANDVTPEVKKEVTPEPTKPKPDTRPKRKLGWRAYVLGGSGGTK